jgi:hypothetical protein
VLDRAAGGDLPQDLADLARELVGDDEGDVASDRLLRRVGVELLGGPVPRPDRAVEPLREDRVVRRRHDRGQLLCATVHTGVGGPRKHAPHDLDAAGRGHREDPHGEPALAELEPAGRRAGGERPLDRGRERGVRARERVHEGRADRSRRSPGMRSAARFTPTIRRLRSHRTIPFGAASSAAASRSSWGGLRGSVTSGSPQAKQPPSSVPLPECPRRSAWHRDQ